MRYTRTHTHTIRMRDKNYSNENHTKRLWMKQSTKMPTKPKLKIQNEYECDCDKTPNMWATKPPLNQRMNSRRKWERNGSENMTTARNRTMNEHLDNQQQSNTRLLHIDSNTGMDLCVCIFSEMLPLFDVFASWDLLSFGSFGYLWLKNVIF